MSSSTADGRSVTQSPQDHVPQLTTKRDQSSLKTGLVASEVKGKALLIIYGSMIKGVAVNKENEFIRVGIDKGKSGIN